MSDAIELVAVAPERDLGLVHGWMQAEHVRPWWQLDGPPERVLAYLRAQAALAHLEPWIVRVGGAPAAYVETYRAAEDPLAAHYDARPGDRGWHVLVGPAELRGTGVPRRIGREVVRRLLAEPGVARVLCEPDVRNARMLGYCRAIGGRRVATLDLPDKRAALFAWEPGA